MIIYKITNKINGKVYIGQTVRSLNERICEHLRKKKSLVSKAIHKYGLDNFIIEQIDHAHSINELNTKEQHWIDFYDCIAPNGYNQCEGGGNTFGYHHSEEAKQKMSIGHKGKKCGENNSFYGKTHSDETKKRFSELRKGRKLSDEWKKHIAESQCKKVLCVEKGEVFDSIQNAADYYNLKPTHITRVCKGKRKTTGGFHWRYVESDSN